jgi:hypothetical protein
LEYETRQIAKVLGGEDKLKFGPAIEKLPPANVVRTTALAQLAGGVLMPGGPVLTPSSAAGVGGTLLPPGGGVGGGVGVAAAAAGNGSVGGAVAVSAARPFAGHAPVSALMQGQAMSGAAGALGASRGAFSVPGAVVGPRAVMPPRAFVPPRPLPLPGSGGAAMHVVHATLGANVMTINAARMRRLGDVGASLDGLVSFGAMCAGHLRGSVKTTVGCYHPCPTAADVPTPLSDDDARSCVVPFAPSATTTTTVYDAPTPSAVVDAALVDGDCVQLLA